MHVQVVGHFLEHQGAQRDLAVFEKGLLALDDRLGHALDGGVALFDIAHQPARFLQFLRHGAAVVEPRAPEQFGIDVMQAGLRHGAAIGQDAPARTPLVDEHVRHHVRRRLVVVAAAGFGVERADQRAGIAQGVFGAVQRAPQAGGIVLGQPVDLLAHDAQRQRPQRCLQAGGGLQLQRQAFLQVARAQARRIQLLHQAQRRQPFAFLGRRGEVRAERAAKAGQRGAQIAVLVERVDDEFGQ